MKKSKTKEIALIAMFAAAAAGLSQLSVYLPFSPIPFSMGIVAVFMTGMLLKPVPAFLSLLAYLIIGAAGAPVFSGFRGGFSVLIGPTGGFLFAYPIMAAFISFSVQFIEKTLKKKFSFISSFPVLTLSLIICYAGGAGYLSIYTHSFAAALKLSVYPFILFDVIKIALSSLLLPYIRKIISGAGMLD